MTWTSIHAVAFMRAPTCEWLPLLSCRSSARGHPLVKDFLFCTSSHWFHVLLLFRCATWKSFSFSVCCADVHLCVASSCLVQVMCAEASSSHWLPVSSALQHTGFQVSLASRCMTLRSLHHVDWLAEGHSVACPSFLPSTPWSRVDGG